MRIPSKLNRILIGLIAFVVAVLAYSYVPLTTPDAYSSPDEAANSFFSARWATHDSLWFFENVMIPSGGTAHPRSMTLTPDSFVAPGGFIGLPVLYGSVAKLTGVAAMPYFTPVLAVLAVLAWGALVGKYMGKRAGWIAAALLFVQPAWWYEGARTMQPNVPFCALLIFAGYFFFVSPLRGLIERTGRQVRLLQHCDALLGGMMLALALAVRTSEAYWIVLGGAALLALRWKQVPWARVGVAFVGTAACIAPFMYLNHVIYGSVLGSGYGSVSAVSENVATLGMGNRLLGPVRPYLFPLGFAPRTALANAWAFGVAFFWWWSLAVAAALAMFVRNIKHLSGSERHGGKDFAVVAGIITAWLVFFYGSYLAGDSGHGVTIGSSYFRYWLPIAVLSTVPLTWLLSRICAAWNWKKLAAGAAVVAVASGMTVMHAPHEGLVMVSRSINEHVAVAQKIFELTPEGSMIVTDTEDKYLFPYRTVLVPLRSEAVYKAIPKLTGFGPIYYFGITLPEKDIAYLQDVKFAESGIQVVAVETFGEQTLYELKRPKN